MASEQPQSVAAASRAVSGAVLLAVASLALFGCGGKSPKSTVPPVTTTTTTPVPISLFNPLGYLKWDDFEGKERFDGTLTVPLNPQDSDASPKLKLRLSIRPSPTQPAPMGTMVLHCGGPSSGRECLDQRLNKKYQDWHNKEVVDKYNLVAVDQRGIGDSEPKTECGVTETVLPPVTGSKPKIRDFFPNCACDGAPHNTVQFTADDEKASSDYFEALAAVTEACYASDHLKMGSKGEYNVLGYMGTTYFAHDLDLFRLAINEEKLSIYGESYGTWVAGAYASIYPESTGLVVMDSNLPPAPTINDLTVDYAMQAQAVLAEYASRCSAMGKNCSDRDPMAAFEEATEKLDNGEYYAESDFGKVYLSPKFITENLHAGLQDLSHLTSNPSWKLLFLQYLGFAKFVNNMLDTDNETMTTYVEKELDFICYVTLPEAKWDECKDRAGNHLGKKPKKGFFDCPTWKQYGVCVQAAKKPAEMRQSLLFSAVFSADVPSHMLPSQMVEMETRLKRDFGVVGAQAAVVWDMAMVLPSKATYPAIGSLEVAPLIIGLLEDSQTGYRWTQRMKLAFPGSSLMTFQGFFHTLPSPWMKREPGDKGFYQCWEQTEQYVKTGVLPRNGFTCHVKKYGIDPPPRMISKTWSIFPEMPARQRRGSDDTPLLPTA